MTKNNEIPSEQTEYSKVEREEILTALKKYEIADANDLLMHTEKIVFGMYHSIFRDENSSPQSTGKSLITLYKQCVRR